MTTSTKNTSIGEVSDTERLNPSSILPWRDPEPMPKEQQVKSVKRRQETLIDRFVDRREKARA
ncbi:hypothetical protein PN419_00220 [Halorubrum ezzemoulense]|uniref:hypothetical protein n=1 Tax=Halorubrum ezzemoulense TaxID=337243 RepID=UPI00232F6472|nr:hypothetical protein [Halorubrum ezzemoulense]MDB9247431.1 hypothetical protein [Halorubrum ezzemoulense]MDB9258660.1 hypothetical protein [Halorubrum ezzemoulense]MDB9264482.1 hypothetical protein [Halorubrum ezzemoulense]MDB9269021.1 hypothetical protein [Halorubrum ezzemoulense]MDB9271450.1 hypothetical protein [Halorubrum ezzemoulense]